MLSAYFLGLLMLGSVSSVLGAIINSSSVTIAQEGEVGWGEGTQEEKTVGPKDICTPMFAAALLTGTKRWKHRTCPWMDEWISKMWSLLTIE